MMEEDLDGVLFNIRACILSSKGAVPLRDLKRDYETLVGSPIPFHQMNYPTLESFLKSFPTLRLVDSGRDLAVQAAQDKSSSHMSSLISKQKSAPKKRNYAPPPRRGQHTYSGGRGYPPRYSTPRYSTPAALAPKQYSQPQSQNYSSQLAQYAQSQQKREAPRNSPEPLVVKVDPNDRRQVHWNPNTKGISVTIKTNEDEKHDPQPQQFTRFRSHKYR